MKYICDLCAWEYDEAIGMPEENIPAGTAFDALSDDFVCPLCGADKTQFSQN